MLTNLVATYMAKTLDIVLILCQEFFNFPLINAITSLPLELLLFL